MRDWTPERTAAAAGARLVSGATSAAAGPDRVVVDSRQAGPGALFVGLVGEHEDGGSFAPAALAAGAWGVLVTPEHAERVGGGAEQGVVLAVEDPLVALGRIATTWRRELGATVIGITGSTGKTSTKDILEAMLSDQRRVVATPANRNTEIGMPMVIAGAPPGTEVLVLEMAMRGAGQIAELAAVAEPDIGVIVNVGPVHLELLGSIEAIAAAKAELIAGLAPGATAIVPAGAQLLDPHLRTDLRTITFGPGGDVAELGDVTVSLPGAHMQTNALAALAAARAAGVEPHGRVEVALSALRGQRLHLPADVVVIDDCYNANPMSMRAALEDLAATGPARRIAVLGDMLELGPDEGRYHAEIGVLARDSGVDLLITVGPLAARMGAGFGGAVLVTDTAEQAADVLADALEPGDTVLVKASRGVGLEVVAQRLAAAGGGG